MFLYFKDSLVNLDNVTYIENEATHSRDFSHELVATYIK